MHSNTQVSENKGPLFYFFAVCGYALHRLITVYFIHPFYLYSYPLEEPFRGTMGMEMLRGLAMPLWDYAPDHYAGGSFVIGWLASLMFRIFPATAFTLKLISIGWMSAALFCWLKLGDRWLGRKTALIFSLLFIFAPPLFVRYSLTTLGDHTETILFSGFSLLALMETLYGDPRFKDRWAFAAGMVSGFGIWFAYVHAVFVFAFLIFWALADARFWKNRTGLLFLTGGIIGFLPWILQNLHSGFQGTRLFDQPLWEHFQVRYVWENILHWKGSFPVRLAASFFMGDMVLRGWVSALTVNISYTALYGLPIAVAGAAYVRKRPDSLRHPSAWNPVIRFTVLYLIVFSAVTQWSNFSAIRYLIPAQPLVFLLAAASLASWGGQKNDFSKRVRTGHVIFFAVVTTVFYVPMIGPLRWAGDVFRVPGVHYAWFAQAPVCFESKNCPEVYDKLKSRLAPAERRQLCLGAAYSAASSFDLPALKGPADLPVFQDSEFEKTFYYFLGAEAFYQNLGTIAGVSTWPRKWGLSEENQRPFYLGLLVLGGEEGIGMGARPEDSPLFTSVYFKSAGKQQTVKFFERGGSYKDWLSGIKGILQNTQDPFQRKETLKGMGLGLHYAWQQNPRQPSVDLRRLNTLPKQDQKSLLEGVGFAVALADNMDHAFVLSWQKEALLQGLSDAEKKAVRRGEAEFLEFLNPGLPNR